MLEEISKNYVTFNRDILVRGAIKKLTRLMHCLKNNIDVIET